MARRARPQPMRREPIFGPPATTPEEALVRFGNALHWEAEHRPVAELTGGRYTFAEARAIWKRSESDGMRSTWDDPAAFLRFLLVVRDTIDPHAWPASAPRFRPEPSGARPRKR